MVRRRTSRRASAKSARSLKALKKHLTVAEKNLVAARLKLKAAEKYKGISDRMAKP